ncbi:hypothetical protein [Dickeya solani]|uniref:Transposase n=1 Tax=Dickeya solani TaxID=1089444 RepID=A0ABU4EH85_9GAMM|nr:hypothetical protein [Dickeya solani]MCZ0823881.1 hypothetical protein [Dickeya solani]MDV6995591.1 hypothetical protein [Dickeya solani]MDV7002870.1 hypothetical protein [Dickeya solani]MDV7036646.1 hypothetical protein [Dickeya solani]MDV7043399.1 hypothetical protein [Dickeya solani]
MTLADYFKSLPMKRRLEIAEYIGCSYNVLYRNYIMLDKKTMLPAKHPRPRRYQRFVEIFSPDIGEIAVHRHFSPLKPNDSSSKRAILTGDDQSIGQ